MKNKKTTHELMEEAVGKQLRNFRVVHPFDATTGNGFDVYMMSIDLWLQSHLEELYWKGFDDGRDKQT